MNGEVVVVVGGGGASFLMGKSRGRCCAVVAKGVKGRDIVVMVADVVVADVVLVGHYFCK